MILTHITICLVVASVSLAYNPGKNCNDCQFVLSCPVAAKLLEQDDDYSKDQLRKAFCGFESGSPKVCCSEFGAPQTGEDVEQHPNLNLLPKKCGVNDKKKIFGGKAAGLYEFPWMALISYSTRFGLDFQCGGTLINERYVLTAAHCIANKNIAGVRVGEHDIYSKRDCQGEPPELVCESNIQDRMVEKAISHPNYQGKASGLKNDIGLLRLNPPIDFSFKNADAVCLPVTSALRNIDITGENATVAGWGFTENHSPSSKLLKVIIPIYSKEACGELYNKFTKAGEEDKTLNKLCAGEKGKDSCGGDSGGPLMTGGIYNNVSRYIQYGIVSYGPTDCGSGAPGVYTDVRKYMKWILDNIQP